MRNGDDPTPELERGAPALPAVPWQRPGGTVIALVPIALVLITFLFWYQTWFGRRLTDAEVGQYLADTSRPHRTQHALAQLAERIARGDPTVQRWYPQILGLAGSQQVQFRLMAAWVMGQDSRTEGFHQELRKLIGDSDLMVRWNAALGLARWRDPLGEPQLRLMLRPYSLVAPKKGTINFRLKEHDVVRSGSLVARIRTGDGAGPVEVRSPVPGQVERRMTSDGAAIRAGEEVAILSPGEAQVWESMRALYLVGTGEDLGDVDRFARGAPGMTERVRQQATLTLEAIRRRTATGTSD